MRNVSKYVGNALVTILILSGCASRSLQRVPASGSEAVRVTELPPVDISGVSVHAQQLCYASGTCVDIMIDRPWIGNTNYLPSGGSEHYMNLRMGNGKLSPSARLVKIPADYFENPQTNCHGYSQLMSGIPGLPKQVWIENPESLLTKFYDVVQSGVPEQLTSENLQRLVREKDLILLMEGNGADRFSHSGVLFVEQRNGRPAYWIRSKFGEIDVFDVPVEDIRMTYKFFDSFTIYRLK